MQPFKMLVLELMPILALREKALLMLASWGRMLV